LTVDFPARLRRNETSSGRRRAGNDEGICFAGLGLQSFRTLISCAVGARDRTWTCTPYGNGF